ncbi:response regulator [Sphingobacterium sp. E70]|nr:response regulator [Sphingobacterium sp. E70]
MYASSAELFKNIVTDAPLVLLLDINLPDANGIDLVKGLKEAHKELKIVAFSVHNELAVINSILNEGQMLIFKKMPPVMKSLLLYPMFWWASGISVRKPRLYSTRKQIPD